MSGKLTRLRTEQESLTQEWNKLQEKVKRLSQDLAIESGAARKFQLEQELAEAKAQKASVERELEAVEDAIAREANLRPFDSNPSVRTAAVVSSEQPIVQSSRRTTVSDQFVQVGKFIRVEGVFGKPFVYEHRDGFVANALTFWSTP
jgi:seryl-tRNA synthetase